MGNEAKKGNLKKVLIWAFAVFMAIALVCAILYSAGIFQRNLKAVKVDDYKISGAEYKVYYSDSRTAFLSQNQDNLGSIGINANYDIDSQIYPYDTTMTWGDYFHESAISYLTEVYTLYGMAEEAGYKMSNTAISEMNTYLMNLTYSAMYSGYNTEGYIKSVYGSYMNYDLLYDILFRRYTATGYYKDCIVPTFGITMETIDAYYDENKDNYDVYDYLGYTFEYDLVTYNADDPDCPASSAEEARKMTEANRSEAMAKAEAMVAGIDSRESFLPLAKAAAEAEAAEKAAEGTEEEEDKKAPTYETEADVLRSTAYISKIGSALDSADSWCKEEGRKEGDIEILANGDDQTITVVYFIGRRCVENDTVSMRHILLNTETVPTDATEEEKAEIEKANAEVLTKLEDLKAQWEADGKTVERFAELADQYSEDTGSIGGLGGLYEEFTRGTMVDAIDDWCFDESRKEGDYEIIETSYGYHLVYFVGQGRYEYQVAIEELLTNEKYQEYYEVEKLNHSVSFNQLLINLL